MLRTAISFAAACCLILGSVTSIPSPVAADNLPVYELRRPELQGEPETPWGTVPARHQRVDDPSGARSNSQGQVTNRLVRAAAVEFVRSSIFHYIHRLVRR